MNETRRRLLLRAAAAVASCGLGTNAVLAQHHQMDMGMPMSMPPPGPGVLVFAAATLKPALDEIVKSFHASGGGAVSVAYGPSPALAKQIENGAPADLFFSADVQWMDYLAERKLIQPASRVDLLGNQLVLVGGGSGGSGSPVAIDRAFPIAKLVGTGPLAMCNPADHPAGRYAKASLESLGLWTSVAGKIAIVENPQVAVMMVARGDAPTAVVFTTDAKGVAGARVLGVFPDASHPAIVYPVAMTTTGHHPADGQRFLAALRSADARQIFDRFGYR